MKSNPQTISGWGNYPCQPCHLSSQRYEHEIQGELQDKSFSHYIARGLGRAYGDSSLNQDQAVLIQTRRNRFLAFDSATGILACEAGTSFQEILEHFLPQGWTLPTTPGTKYVTVGGAIAADVHGKNHHQDGSFGNYVTRFRLLTGNNEILTCTPTEHAEVFWATIGGMGLTGIILDAHIRLQTAASSYFHVTYRRTRNLLDTLDVFQQSDDNYRYSVAWIDGLASGKSLGRSVVMLANNSQAEDLPPLLKNHPLQLPRKLNAEIPCHLPGFVLNPISVQMLNQTYYNLHRDGQRWIDMDSFFYPLDRIQHWNRAYGRRGFIQYQALFPHKSSLAGLTEMLERITRSRRASFLAVLKRCGPANDGILSYLYPGHTLALDFPHTGDDLTQLISDLDQVLLKHGGRLYLAKDAMMSAETFATMYPRLPEFQAVKSRVDPDKQFVSSQARRLGIV